MNWIHCNRCYLFRTGSDENVPFFMTSCGHIFCGRCTDGSLQKCLVLNNDCSYTLLTIVQRDHEDLFSSLSLTFHRSMRVMDFQLDQYSSMLNYLMDRLGKYNAQKQEVMTLKSECKRHREEKNNLKTELIQKHEEIRQLKKQVENLQQRYNSQRNFFEKSSDTQGKHPVGSTYLFGGANSQNQLTFNGMPKGNNTQVFTPPQPVGHHKSYRDNNVYNLSTPQRGTGLVSPPSSEYTERRTPRSVLLPGDKGSSPINRIGLQRLNLKCTPSLDRASQSSVRGPGRPTRTAQCSSTQLVTISDFGNASAYKLEDDFFPDNDRFASPPVSEMRRSMYGLPAVSKGSMNGNRPDISEQILNNGGRQDKQTMLAIILATDGLNNMMTPVQALQQIKPNRVEAKEAHFTRGYLFKFLAAEARKTITALRSFPNRRTFFPAVVKDALIKACQAKVNFLKAIKGGKAPMNFQMAYHKKPSKKPPGNNSSDDNSGDSATEADAGDVTTKRPGKKPSKKPGKKPTKPPAKGKTTTAEPKEAATKKAKTSLKQINSVKVREGKPPRSRVKSRGRLQMKNRMKARGRARKKSQTSERGHAQSKSKKRPSRNQAIRSRPGRTVGSRKPKRTPRRKLINRSHRLEYKNTRRRKMERNSLNNPKKLARLTKNSLSSISHSMDGIKTLITDTKVPQHISAEMLRQKLIGKFSSVERKASNGSKTFLGSSHSSPRRLLFTNPVLFDQLSNQCKAKLDLLHTLLTPDLPDFEIKVSRKKSPKYKGKGKKKRGKKVRRIRKQG